MLHKSIVQLGIFQMEGPYLLFYSIAINKLYVFYYTDKVI